MTRSFSGKIPGGEAATAHYLVREYLRELVAILSEMSEESNGDAVVKCHTTKILNAITRQLSHLPSLGQLVDIAAARQVLRDLKRIGDVLKLADGFWAGTPLRFIKLHEGRHLISCGHPTWLLRERLKLNIDDRRLCRVVDLSEHEAAEIPIDCKQSMHDWSHRIFSPTKSWFADRMKTASDTARDVSGEVLELQVFAPWERRGWRQPKQWVAIETLRRAPEHFVICRYLSPNRNTQIYVLAELSLRGDDYLIARETEVHKHELADLMLGVCAFTGVEVNCVSRTSETSFELELDIRLPLPEFITLSALSIPVIPRSSRNSHLYLVEDRSLLQSALGYIGIQMKDAED